MGQKHRNRSALKQGRPAPAPVAGMPPDPVAGVLQQAMTHHKAGRLAEADAHYKDALRLNPRHPVALLYRGALALQVGQPQPALTLIDLALEAKPDYAEAWNNRGNVLKALDDTDGAITCYARAFELAPGYAEALYNLALAFKQTDRLEEAEAAYRRVIALNPTLADAHNNLGNLARQRGDDAEALACYRRALEADPTYAEAHHNIGNALAQQDDLVGAIACYEAAVEAKPSHAQAWEHLAHVALEAGEPKRAVEAARTALTFLPENAKLYGVLGKALKTLGQRDAALEAMQRAEALAPEDAFVLNDFGLLLEWLERYDEAIAVFERAIAADPSLSRPYLNLGNTLKHCRNFTDAMKHYRKALEVDPDYSTAHTNILMLMHYMPEAGKQEIFAEHKRWDARFGAPLAPSEAAYANVPDPDRRLRVGFLSGSFMRHPATALSLAGLENVDKQKFEFIAFNNNAKVDPVTERVRKVMDRWVSVIGVSDEVAAKRIRDAEIDILVDLSGHAGDNRLLTVARRPAPIQVKWVGGQFNTSGLSAMDYFISDAVETPPGEDEFYTETIIRLPDDYIVYDPPSYAPEISPLPALENGFMTFGCFNNIIKINREVIGLWARLLHALPDSRLILKAVGLSNAILRDGILNDFAAFDIPPDRLLLEGRSPHDQLLATYNRVDIALDPYPYSGGLTTCEALWMGVPVVTRPGPTFAGRHSATHLTHAGFGDWLVDNEEAYFQKAVWWAGHLDELAALRARLRDQVAASPLCDGPRFARNLENALRAMWRTWCSEQGAE